MHRRTCLKVNLRSHLADARVAGRSDVTEAARREITIGIVELRMVEDIEKLTPDVHRDAFGKTNVLKQRDIPAVKTGAMKEPAVGVTRHTQRLATKIGRREIFKVG